MVAAARTDWRAVFAPAPSRACRGHVDLERTLVRCHRHRTVPIEPRQTRPPLRLRLTPFEAAEFTVAYEQAERDGQYDFKVSLGDQLLVREQLLRQLTGVPETERERYERRADRLIELAFWAGMAAALAHLHRSDQAIDALARAQEWTA
jgi:hypothetical protein